MSYTHKKYVEAGKKGYEKRVHKQAGIEAWKTMRTFDGKVWKSGNALVITIPYTTVERFNIKEGDLLEVTIKK